MTETIEQVCQRILDARGYLVVCSPYGVDPERVIESVETLSGTLNHKVSVVRETDLHDFIAQCRLLAHSELSNNPQARYWRVIAE